MIKEITNEDIELVKSNMILQIVLQIIVQDSSQVIPNANAALKQFYVSMFEQLNNTTSTVLSGVNREMFKRGIKIESTKRTTKDFTANYLCRGSAGECQMDWEVIKAEAEKRMRAYLKVEKLNSPLFKVEDKAICLRAAGLRPISFSLTTNKKTAGNYPTALYVVQNKEHVYVNSSV